jgi:hypothetical protein
MKNGWKNLFEFTRISLKQGDCTSILKTVGYMVQTAIGLDGIQQISKFQAQSCKNIRDPFESRDQNWVCNTQKAKDPVADFSSCF